jgi:DNA ligase (NAD+)
MDELQQARQRPLHRLLFGLGIPLVGERAAKLLAATFGSLEALAGADSEQLEAIDGIGPAMAASLRQWFAAPRNQSLVERLRERGVDPTESVASRPGEGLLAGDVIVITGSLSRPRSQFKERLEALGATTAGSVSRRTTLLLAGDGGGSKLDKARSLDVRVVDEDALEQLIRERGGAGLWQQ